MRRLFKDAILPVAVAVALAFVIQAAVAKPYEIPTGSMVPTIQNDDRIIANRVIYRIRDIQRGDIIVFTPTESARISCGETQGNIPFVKRVIGLGGDRVEVQGGKTIVNGEEYIVDKAVAPDYEKTWSEVPQGQLLVLGDNRRGSCDSSQWAPDPFVPEENVIGQAEITYWPYTSLKFLN